MIAIAALLVVASACSDDKQTTPSSSASETSSLSEQTTSTSIKPVPAGFLSIPAPPGIDATRFGQNVAVTSMGDGRPVVAFSFQDETAETSQVEVAVFDDATQTFREPVIVGGAVLGGVTHSVDIAFDQTAGALVVVWDDGGTKVMEAESADLGATFAVSTVIDTAVDVSGVSVAVAQGNVTVAYSDASSGVDVARAKLGARPFQTAPVQPPAGTTILPLAPAVTSAPDGAPVLAYFVTPADGGAAIAVAQLNTGVSTIAMTSNGVQNDSPAVDIAYAGSSELVGASLCRTPEETDACTFVTTSADGQAYAEPVAVPPDGGAGAPLDTITVAADSANHGVLAYLPNTSDGTSQCGDPKLAISPDLVTWTTCSPDKDGTLGFGSGAPALAAAANGNLFVAFQQASEGAHAPTGILVDVLAPLENG